MAGANHQGNTTKPDRVLYFDILRIVASFFVIMLHVSAQNWDGDINTFEWGVLNFYDGISRWSVPAFVMISGGLFLNRKIRVKRIYTRYIFRIVTAFIFWSAIYSVVTEYFTWSAFHAMGYNFIGYKSMLDSFLKGHYHMWFLFMIVGLYMITPFLRQITSSKSLTRYFIMLGIVFAFLVPQAKSVVSLFSEDWGNLINDINTSLHLHFVLGFSCYFMLGYYLNKYRISRRLETAVVFCGIIGFVATVVLTAWASRMTESPNAIFYSYNSLNVFAESVFVFIACKRIVRKMAFSDRARPIIRRMSKYSFGVYLVHVIVMDILKRGFKLHPLSFNPILAVPVIALIVFVVSYIISAAINHIPVLKKYIV